MPPSPVAVVGATGYTGGLVAADLARRGLPLRLIGRNPARLDDVAGRHDGAEARPVTTWQAKPLTDALEGCSAVVSCAGPFLIAGRPVVDAAVAARVSYCDSTGEQPFIRAVFEELDAPARSAGVALVPAFGYDYVPGDLGVAIAAEGLGPLERVDVVYVAEKPDTSVGTRRTAVEMLSRPAYQRVGGSLRRESLGARRRSMTTRLGRLTAGSFPGGEAVTVPRHIEVDTVINYVALPGPLSPASPAVRVLPLVTAIPGMVGLFRRLAERGPAVPGEGALSGYVACHVQVAARDGRRRAVLVEGQGAYRFTAASLAGLAQRFAEGRVDATGALAPAQAVEPRAFLADAGMTVREVDPE